MLIALFITDLGSGALRWRQVIAAVTAVILSIVVVGALLARSRAPTQTARDRTIVMWRGQWKVPLGTIRCLSGNHTENAHAKRVDILEQDYSDVPEINAVFSKGFGNLPVNYDDASCPYVHFSAVRGRSPVQYKGRYSEILGSIAVCEWSIANRVVDPNRCSQKNIWFFRTDIAPIELLTVAVSAFVERQDQDWQAFNPDAARTAR